GTAQPPDQGSRAGVGAAALDVGRELCTDIDVDVAATELDRVRGEIEPKKAQPRVAGSARNDTFDVRERVGEALLRNVDLHAILPYVLVPVTPSEHTRTARGWARACRCWACR